MFLFLLSYFPCSIRANDQSTLEVLQEDGTRLAELLSAPESLYKGGSVCPKGLTLAICNGESI